ncbi:MAG TPA: response regulator transcription factor [Solirubrobacteraceae bacterium]|nr:response regulator transcription factor [Solirubrobacteraceae bacterium]
MTADADRPLRVLLAHKHEPTRAGVTAALEAGGIRVAGEAADADALVDLARRAAADVALVDPLLPGGGARAAAELLRARDVAHVVMLAGGDVDDGQLFAALDAGASGFLLKDTDPDRLPHAVRGVADGEAAIPRILVPRVLAELRRRGSAGPPQLVADGRPLSEREWEVLQLLAEGLATREIARRLGISDVTVRRHVGALVAKLGVEDRAAAVRLLRRRAT